MARPQRRPYRKGVASYSRTPFPAPPVNGYSLELTNPPNGAMTRSARPEIFFIPRSILGDPVDVQVEWRTSEPQYVRESPGSEIYIWVPVPTYEVLLSGLSSGDEHETQPPTDLSTRTWYYRMRAGHAATDTWGSWTASARHVNIQSPQGSVVSYTDINIGVALPEQQGAVAYAEMNVGVTFKETDLGTGAVYSEFNVGINTLARLIALYADLNIHPPFIVKSGAAYADLNVTTDRPDPTIWWVRPDKGKEGYIFNIYGHGFGAFQNEYDGEVQLGDLVCAISRWEKIPAALLTSVVTVSGRPRATLSTTTIPTLVLHEGPHVVAAGDIIEYDLKWDYPEASRLDIFPTFTISGTGLKPGTEAVVDLLDHNNAPWVTDVQQAYGQWHHRRFVVPEGHFLVGRTLTQFGLAWYGSNAQPPTRSAAVRAFVIRRTDESVALWVTGDDDTSTPVMRYVANGGVLESSDFARDSHVIQKGVALDPDIITPEHGWIVAIVPGGAVSSMVQVVLGSA